MTEEEVLHALHKKALGNLGRRDYSERQLAAALLNLKKWYPRSRLYREYTSNRVDKVIKELVSGGFINERRSLRNMLEAAKAGQYGIRRIRMRMIRQKYKKEYIEEVLRESGDFEQQQDMSKIIRLAKSKKTQWEAKYAGDRKKLATVRTRLIQFLASKGFTMDTINRLLPHL